MNKGIDKINRKCKNSKNLLAHVEKEEDKLIDSSQLSSYPVGRGS